MLDYKLGTIPVTPFQQNCTVIWEPDTLRAAVVDPGGEVEKILGILAKLELKVEMLLLTHGHLDHAGGAKALKAALDVPLLGPDARDQFLLDGIEESARNFGLQGMHNVVPDRHLVEGEVIALGRMRFDVLHVPGHSPGHVVFIEQERRFGITGDTLFCGSVGRTDFPYGDGDLLITGIKEKLLPLGDDMNFLPGHGPGGTFGEERQTNGYLQP